MSAHHYFREFSYCDSGMIPWLLVAELMCQRGKSLSALVGERMRQFPASGEINRKVEDAKAADRSARKRSTQTGAVAMDHTDGLSIEFADWRFNLRASNTEPLLRLNVESRGDEQLMQRQDGRALRAASAASRAETTMERVRNAQRAPTPASARPRRAR